MGLSCIGSIQKYAPKAPLAVVQVGKSREQKDKFRGLLPGGIREITFPHDMPCQHHQVLEHLIKGELATLPGVWFFDHDAFLGEEADDFFKRTDIALANSKICLLTPNSGGSLTQPAFWISPARLAHDLPSLAPQPERNLQSSQTPCLLNSSVTPKVPTHDTLELAWQELAPLGRASSYPLEFFPKHVHLGGLHALTWADRLYDAGFNEPLTEFQSFLKKTVIQLANFFDHCPDEWVRIEEPNLMKRLAMLRGGLSA